MTHRLVPIMGENFKTNYITFAGGLVHCYCVLQGAAKSKFVTFYSNLFLFISLHVLPLRLAYMMSSMQGCRVLFQAEISTVYINPQE